MPYSSLVPWRRYLTVLGRLLALALGMVLLAPLAVVSADTAGHRDRSAKAPLPAAGAVVNHPPAVTRPRHLALPRIPWEGGPAYWRQFPNARRWTDPAFFPIGIWYNGISSDAEVQWDKAHGINFYTGMWEGTPFSLFRRNHVYWVGERLNSSFDPKSPYWPGVFMDDEVDGRSATPQQGFDELSSIKKQYATSGKFLWANFTQMVMGSDLPLDDQERYVNDFTDAVSIDMYWYTIPFCDWTPYQGGSYAAPVPLSTCRTASSYGHTMNGLTKRDAADGRRQARWGFVENLNGLSGYDHVADITPGQLRGAAMNQVINEARGLVWFNQSFTGPCETGSALRTAQVEGPSWCGYRQIQAMGRVNRLIERLAPVINTQSYRWRFGRGLDTMLKTHGRYAYVFAMTNGTAGTRSFQLPSGVTGTKATVIGEHRSIRIKGHRFVDSFAHEFTYHIYRIRL